MSYAVTALGGSLVSQTSQYPLVILLIAVAGLLAVLASRLTERIKLPVPALMLVAAAVAVKLVPALQQPSERTVERLVTACLVGGMPCGAVRRPASRGP